MRTAVLAALLVTAIVCLSDAAPARLKNIKLKMPVKGKFWYATLQDDMYHVIKRVLKYCNMNPRKEKKSLAKICEFTNKLVKKATTKTEQAIPPSLGRTRPHPGMYQSGVAENPSLKEIVALAQEGKLQDLVDLEESGNLQQFMDLANEGNLHNLVDLSKGDELQQITEMMKGGGSLQDIIDLAKGDNLQQMMAVAQGVIPDSLQQSIDLLPDALKQEINLQQMMTMAQGVIPDSLQQSIDLLPDTLTQGINLQQMTAMAQEAMPDNLQQILDAFPNEVAHGINLQQMMSMAQGVMPDNLQQIIDELPNEVAQGINLQQMMAVAQGVIPDSLQHNIAESPVMREPLIINPDRANDEEDRSFTMKDFSSLLEFAYQSEGTNMQSSMIQTIQEILPQEQMMILLMIFQGQDKVTLQDLPASQLQALQAGLDALPSDIKATLKDLLLRVKNENKHPVAEAGRDPVPNANGNFDVGEDEMELVRPIVPRPREIPHDEDKFNFGEVGHMPLLSRDISHAGHLVGHPTNAHQERDKEIPGISKEIVNIPDKNGPKRPGNGQSNGPGKDGSNRPGMSKDTVNTSREVAVMGWPIHQYRPGKDVWPLRPIKQNETNENKPSATRPDKQNRPFLPNREESSSHDRLSLEQVGKLQDLIASVNVSSKQEFMDLAQIDNLKDLVTFSEEVNLQDLTKENIRQLVNEWKSKRTQTENSDREIPGTSKEIINTFGEVDVMGWPIHQNRPGKDMWPLRPHKQNETNENKPWDSKPNNQNRPFLPNRGGNGGHVSQQDSHQDGLTLAQVGKLLDLIDFANMSSAKEMMDLTQIDNRKDLMTFAQEVNLHELTGLPLRQNDTNRQADMIRQLVSEWKNKRIQTENSDREIPGMSKETVNTSGEVGVNGWPIHQNRPGKDIWPLKPHNHNRPFLQNREEVGKLQDLMDSANLGSAQEMMALAKIDNFKDLMTFAQEVNLHDLIKENMSLGLSQNDTSANDTNHNRLADIIGQLASEWKHKRNQTESNKPSLVNDKMLLEERHNNNNNNTTDESDNSQNADKPSREKEDTQKKRKEKKERNGKKNKDVSQNSETPGELNGDDQTNPTPKNATDESDNSQNADKPSREKEDTQKKRKERKERNGKKNEDVSQNSETQGELNGDDQTSPTPKNKQRGQGKEKTGGKGKGKKSKHGEEKNE